MRSKISLKTGKFYFEPIPDAEFEKQKDNIFPRLEGVHTQKELENFLAKMVDHKIDVYNTVCYQIYLIPDFNETEGRVILVANHSIGDGMSGFSMLALLQPSEDMSGFPRVSPPSFLTQLYCNLMAPIAIIQIFAETSNLKHRITAIQRADGPAKTKEVRLLESIKLSEVKQVSKHYGTTFNVIVQSLISQTIKEYCVRHGDSNTDPIAFVSTFSLRQFAKDLKEFEMGNHAVILAYEFPLETDLEVAVQKIKAIFKTLVGGPKLIGFRKMAEFMISLPY